jgi:hypothetical protein
MPPLTSRLRPDAISDTGASHGGASRSEWRRGLRQAAADSNHGWAVGHGGVIYSTANGGVPAPAIASFVPAAGLPGTTVTVTGTDFTNATSASIGATAASFSLVSDTQFTLNVPNGAISGPITG